MLLVALLALGCGGSEPRPVEPRLSATPGPEPEPAEAPPSGPRAIGPTSSFGDLVAAASVVDDRGEGASSHDCMLRRPERQGWPWLLEADVASSVRPLPAPPEDLDARLVVSQQPVLVLSRWGQIGSRAFDVAVAMFTNAPPLPSQETVVLILTNRGRYRRLADRRVSAGEIEPVSASEATGAIPDVSGSAMVVVTAEAGVPLADVARVLAALPDGARVAFAVPLGEEIRVPDPPEPPADRDTGMCPDGLPELPLDALRGTLARDQIVAALGPLRDRARQCLETSAGTRAAGGLAEVMMRVGPDGSVIEACVVNDELGGTELRHCLIQAAREIRFPAPDPSGHVDMSLPLRLTPTYQRAMCE
jgi:hypothetical protein